jgi:hypothetical protein
MRDLFQVSQEETPSLQVPGANGQSVGQQPQQAEMMVAKQLYGRAGGACYILLPP